MRTLATIIAAVLAVEIIAAAGTAIYCRHKRFTYRPYDLLFAAPFFVLVGLLLILEAWERRRPAYRYTDEEWPDGLPVIGPRAATCQRCRTNERAYCAACRGGISYASPDQLADGCAPLTPHRRFPWN